MGLLSTPTVSFIPDEYIYISTVAAVLIITVASGDCPLCLSLFVSEDCP